MSAASEQKSPRTKELMNNTELPKERQGPEDLPSSYHTFGTEGKTFKEHSTYFSPVQFAGSKIDNMDACSYSEKLRRTVDSSPEYEGLINITDGKALLSNESGKLRYENMAH